MPLDCTTRCLIGGDRQELIGGCGGRGARQTERCGAIDEGPVFDFPEHQLRFEQREFYTMQGGEDIGHGLLLL
jgi:hypothetical protein